MDRGHITLYSCGHPAEWITRDPDYNHSDYEIYAKYPCLDCAWKVKFPIDLSNIDVSQAIE